MKCFFLKRFCRLIPPANIEHRRIPLLHAQTWSHEHSPVTCTRSALPTCFAAAQQMLSHRVGFQTLESCDRVWCLLSFDPRWISSLGGSMKHHHMWLEHFPPRPFVHSGKKRWYYLGGGELKTNGCAANKSTRRIESESTNLLLRPHDNHCVYWNTWSTRVNTAAAAFPSSQCRTRRQRNRRDVSNSGVTFMSKSALLLHSDSSWLTNIILHTLLHVKATH